ncbi:LexA family transcriptional regulator [Candidatus Dojkabacteria bacterium]|uniref:LexA family transcriptional regulator n=1 Tax=Candidatus Dojkabacteria bacterium TaxID=2099670 RepID=A0A955RHY2_9BACT|nr:LexA family transcriptional regulator [Candidatus Dojkabacteria bacterium]
MDESLFYTSKLKKFYQYNRRMPSFSEFAEMFGYRSKNSVTKLVAKLKEENLIEQDEKGKIIPTQEFLKIPVFDFVSAGFASPVEENIDKKINLEEYLIEHPTTTFLITVSGDSMEGEGIRDGDIVIVEKGGDPSPGDIVVANIDGGYTLKILRKDSRGKIYLEAANDKYPDFYPEEELSIFGTVKGVVRKYS